MTNWVTQVMVLHVAAQLGIPSLTEAIVSTFLLDTVESDFSSFSANEDWSIINHQQCCILIFSSSYFLIEQWLYFVSPAECMQKIVSLSVSCISVV